MDRDPTNQTATLAKRMGGGDTVLGLIVRIVRSPEIARIARQSGHDFLFIDTQHGIIDLATVECLVQGARASGIAALVRVRGPADPDIARILDTGADGIVVPHVETAADAAAAAAEVKFAPVGRRSVGGGGALTEHQSLPLAQAMAAINERTLLVCMIESRAGLANVSEIAAIPGVDVLHIGANDLLAEMGAPGAFGHPDMAQAVASVVDACRGNGCSAGLGGDRDPDRQIAYARAGVRFITTQSDANYLLAAARDRASRLRAGLHPAKPRAS